LPKATNIRRCHGKPQMLQINGQRSGVWTPIVRHGSLRHVLIFDNS